MDVSTGHLVADINMIAEADRHRYKPVPSDLLEAAQAELDGRREVTVNLNLKSNLAKWAANERKKNRARNKIARRSRAANR